MVVVDPSEAVVVTELVTVFAEEALLVEPLLSVEEDADDDAEDALLAVDPPLCSSEVSETVMLVPVVDEMLVMATSPKRRGTGAGRPPHADRNQGGARAHPVASDKRACGPPINTATVFYRCAVGGSAVMGSRHRFPWRRTAPHAIFIGI